MIDITVVDQAVKLKKEMDAAYLVFKREPVAENAFRWNSAMRAYNDYCISIMTDLVNERIGDINRAEDIAKNFDKYSTCKVCDAELLYKTVGDKYIASSDFVEDFPGWCYPCLLEHCATHQCETCTVVDNTATCKFKEVKEIHVQENKQDT